MPFPFSAMEQYCPSQKSFFLMPGATDMRKSLFALSLQVYSLSGLDPLSGNYFVFVNKRRTIMKIVFWQNGGMCMFQKNLGRKKFFSNMVYSYYIRLKFRFVMNLLDG